MRIFIYSLIICCVSTIQAQSQEVKNPGDYPVPYDESKHMISYDEVVKIEDTDRSTLYDRFMNWGQSHFTNFDAKIEKKDADAEVPFLYFKSYAELEYENIENDRIWYFMKGQFKDNRYRFTIEKFHIRKRTRFPLEKWMKPNITPKEEGLIKCKALDNAMKKLIKKAKDYMANPPQEEDDSW